MQDDAAEGIGPILFSRGESSGPGLNSILVDLSGVATGVRDAQQNHALKTRERGQVVLDNKPETTIRRSASYKPSQ